MNREFYTAKARRESITAARVSHRPLGIWPGDQGHVSVEDLPEVSKEYIEEYPVDGTKVVVGNPPLAFETGKRYGVLTHQWNSSLGAKETVIGVWNT